MYEKCESTEGKANYNADHAANFKQQIVSGRVKYLNSERNLLAIRCLKLCNNQTKTQAAKRVQQTKQNKKGKQQDNRHFTNDSSSKIITTS